MKQKHHEKEQYISMLAQDKEEMKVLFINVYTVESCGKEMTRILIPCVRPPLSHQAKLAELQDLVMRLVAERNDWYSRYAGVVGGASTVNPDLLPVGQEHSHSELQAHTHPELSAASRAGRK